MQRKREFSVLAILLLITISVFIQNLEALSDGWDDLIHRQKPYTYTGQFHETIRNADRIVVRDWGFNCCRSVKNAPAFFTVTDPSEIQDVHNHIKFIGITNELTYGCMCCGDEGIDWYKGFRRLALTSRQHAQSLRWKGFSCSYLGPFRVSYGDIPFTDDSAEWINDWIGSHFNQSKEDKEEEKNRIEIIQEAKAILDQHAPKGFKDKPIRNLFTNEQEMYTCLFRIMGCLSMPWNCRYYIQGKAHIFLSKAPREELDKYFHIAAKSKDSLERQGATRTIYSQMLMRLYDKSSEDIANWATLFIDEGYSNPFPENRRAILSYLISYPDIKALHILSQAIEDPDQTIRRKAIDALAKRNTKKTRKILELVANGKTNIRKPMELPKNYGKIYACDNYYYRMSAKRYEDTDQEAAQKALDSITQN